MRIIDVETWPRREHYRLYRQIDNPHFSMCANVDLTAFYPALKARGAGFTVGILYVLAQAANDEPAFRCRMRGDQVVEHEIVHPGTTVLADDDAFGFCTINFVADFRLFDAGASETIGSAKRQPTLVEEPAGMTFSIRRAFLGCPSPASLTQPIFIQPTASLAWRGASGSKTAAN